MALNIPLPNQFPGRDDSIYGQMNALREQAINNKINSIKAQYAPQMTQEELKKLQLINQYYPLKTLAQAQSQMAYSQLLGPQYIAKLLEHPDIAAQMPQAQKDLLLKTVTNAPFGLQTNPLAQLQQQDQNKSFGSQSEDSITNALFPKKQPQTQAPINTFASPPPMPANMQRPPAGPINQAVAQARQGNAAITPQETQALASPGSPIAPQTTETPVIGGKDEWAQNIANYQSRIAEEKEKGREQGKTISEYGKKLQADYESLLINQNMDKTIASPAFQSMKRHALTGDYDYKWYSKFGTPEQKAVLGKFKSYQGKLVQAATKGFGGQFRISEMPSIERLKPQEGDMVEVMIGKQKATTPVLEAQMQLDSRVSDLMESQHMSEAKAFKIAIKEIDWDALNNKVDSVLDKAYEAQEVRKHPITGANLNEAALQNINGINYVPVTDGKTEQLVPEKNYSAFITKHPKFKRIGAQTNG